ncbi:hypothetical protein AAFP35_15155 [Gordonia sp. CPCC 206044]|uniref:hypothetical protein n=1 Tax=Gordonia sp. CPCC 206044 TaxID=3140793 RepID=UPI003AF3486C
MGRTDVVRIVRASSWHPKKGGSVVIPPIEIKVNLDGEVPYALDRLGMTSPPAERRKIWFAEARSTPGSCALPLLDSHLIIRMRSGEHHDDLTVRLRPCSPRQLPARWSEPFTDGDFSYRLEGDWCGSHRATAASAISRREPGSLAEAMSAGADPAHVLDSGQRQFLVTCTPAGVPIDHLVPLGPIDSWRWSDVLLDGAEVAVERWSVADVDMLEISTVVHAEPGESADDLEARADAAQVALENAVRTRGLTPSPTDMKTQRVLTALSCLLA